MKLKKRYKKLLLALVKGKMKKARMHRYKMIRKQANREYILED